MNHLDTIQLKKDVASRKVLEQKLYIPSNFDLYNKLPSKERKHIDKYAFFTHYLYLARVLDSSIKRHHYVNVNAKELEKYVSCRRYATIKNFWTQNGVIECNGSWKQTLKDSVGFSQGYRFTFDYRHVKATDLSILDETFGKRLITLRIRNIDKINAAVPQHAYLLRNLQDIRIDTNRAYTRLLAITAENPENLDKYNKLHQSINAIVNGDWFCKRDSKGERVHNNYVNLSKEIKPYVYLAHEVTAKIYNLDIASSQPLLLAALLHRDKVYGADVIEYKRHCESGTLYAYLMGKMNLTHLSKKEFKKRVFTFFYAKNEQVANSADFTCFSELFPTVAAYIVARKREDYKALACAMQKLESSIIIDTVVAALANDYPNTWALTVHDSVACTGDMVDVVYNFLNDAFIKHGVTPTINIEEVN